MRLYEIPNRSTIHCEASDGSTFIIFHHLDGMYSYCETEKGNVVHLWASTEIEKDGDDYKLADIFKNNNETQTQSITSKEDDDKTGEGNQDAEILDTAMDEPKTDETLQDVEGTRT